MIIRWCDRRMKCDECGRKLTKDEINEPDLDGSCADCYRKYVDEEAFK